MTKNSHPLSDDLAPYSPKLPSFQWLTSEYSELTEANHQLCLLIQAVPRFYWLWTTGATLLTNGKIALMSKNHITSFRTIKPQGQVAAPRLDLANPNWGPTEPETSLDEDAAAPAASSSEAGGVTSAITFTNDEEKAFFIGPHCVISTDQELFQCIISGIQDTQHREHIMDVANGSGRLAAQELRRLELTKVTIACLDNIVSKIELHVTTGVAAPTHEAYSTWRTAYEKLTRRLPVAMRPTGSALSHNLLRATTPLGREFGIRLGVKIDLLGADRDPEKMSEALDQVLTDWEAANLSEERRAGGHSLKTAPASNHPTIENLTQELSSLKHHLMSKGQPNKARARADPRKSKRPYVPPTEWNPKMRYCRNFAKGLCSGTHLDIQCPHYTPNSGTSHPLDTTKPGQGRNGGRTNVSQPADLLADSPCDGAIFVAGAAYEMLAVQPAPAQDDLLVPEAGDSTPESPGVAESAQAYSATTSGYTCSRLSPGDIEPYNGLMSPQAQVRIPLERQRWSFHSSSSEMEQSPNPLTVRRRSGVPGTSALACEPTFSEGEGSDGANSSPPLSELDEA